MLVSLQFVREIIFNMNNFFAKADVEFAYKNVQNLNYQMVLMSLILHLEN